MLTLDITSRDSKEKPETLRSRGSVPAVYYGAKEKATPITIDGKKLAHVWKEAGETTIITLKGVGEDKDTLIRDVQLHPVSGELLHADFYVLEKGKKIEIDVPLHFEGVAPAEKAGHIVTKVLHEIEIEVTPQELPHALSVDLSVLQNVGDHILVSDIKLPPSAELITDKDEIVASVTEFKEEKVEITPPPETEILTAKPAAEEAAPATEGEKKE